MLLCKNCASICIYNAIQNTLQQHRGAARCFKRGRQQQSQDRPLQPTPMAAGCKLQPGGQPQQLAWQVVSTSRIVVNLLASQVWRRALRRSHGNSGTGCIATSLASGRAATLTWKPRTVGAAPVNPPTTREGFAPPPSRTASAPLPPCLPSAAFFSLLSVGSIDDCTCV